MGRLSRRRSGSLPRWHAMRALQAATRRERFPDALASQAARCMVGRGEPPVNASLVLAQYDEGSDRKG